MKQLKYLNSQGEIIDFRDFDTQILEGNFHTYEWTYDGISRQYGQDIERFRKDPLKYEIVVAARGDGKEENLNRITEIIEYDIQNKKSAKLWWGDYYLKCFIVSSATSPSEKFYGAEKTLGVLAPYPFWLREIHRTFPAVTVAISEEYLDYPYDYSYDYAGSGDNATWFIDHYADSNFEMIIYGPCIDPRITINGHPYYVYDTVEKGEYIKVNSEDNTVIKYRTNGTTKDLYDYRGKIEGRLFEKIPSGNLSIGRNGNFGFDLKLFLERSEPAW